MAAPFFLKKRGVVINNYVFFDVCVLKIWGCVCNKA